MKRCLLGVSRPLESSQVYYRRPNLKKYFFYYNVIKKGVFFILIYIFLLSESKSDVNFRQPEPETIIRKKKTKISGLSGVSGACWRKWITDLDSAGQITPEKYLH